MKFRKSIMAAVMSLVVALSLVVTPINTKAEQTMGTLEDELEATSTYYLNTVLADSILADTYTVIYSDVNALMICIKAGAENEEVLEKMDTLIAQAVNGYEGDSFLGSYEGTKTYAFANAILYLQERQEDVTDYEGKNLVTLMVDTYNNETSINPYTYQLIVAVIENIDDQDIDKATVLAKVKEDVLATYVSDDSGTGITYWGVSADNNGQVLPALLSFYDTDTEVKNKVDAAIQWTDAQKDASGAIVAWGDANVDSTALALKLAAQYGNSESAAEYYNALAQFKSATTDGAYQAFGVDPNAYSTLDVMLGLLAYQSANEEINLFDVRNVVAEDEDNSDDDDSNADADDNSNDNDADEDASDADDELVGDDDLSDDNDTTFDEIYENSDGEDTINNVVTTDKADSNNEDSSKDTITSPETADAQVAIYVIIMIGAALASGCALVYGKKVRS